MMGLLAKLALFWSGFKEGIKEPLPPSVEEEVSYLGSDEEYQDTMTYFLYYDNQDK